MWIINFTKNAVFGRIHSKIATRDFGKLPTSIRMKKYYKRLPHYNFGICQHLKHRINRAWQNIGGQLGTVAYCPALLRAVICWHY